MLKKLIILSLFVSSVALTACSTSTVYNEKTDSTSEGIRVALGAKDKISEGSLLNVIARECITVAKGRSSCSRTYFGQLKVVSVIDDSNSLAVKVGNFTVPDQSIIEKTQ